MFAVFAVFARILSCGANIVETSGLLSSCTDMATDATDPEAAARSTLVALETRLRRLEFLLKGSSNEYGIPDPVRKPAQHNETVWARLDSLDSEMVKLKKLNGSAGTLIRNVEQLCG